MKGDVTCVQVKRDSGESFGTGSLRRSGCCFRYGMIDHICLSLRETNWQWKEKTKRDMINWEDVGEEEGEGALIVGALFDHQ